MSQYFKLVVDTSTISCSSTDMTPATEEALLAANNWSKGSAFFMNDQGFKVEAYITGSTFKNCYTSLQGGVINILSSSQTSKLSIISSTFTKNAANEGGAVYCSGCELVLQKNTMSYNEATRGGDFYLLNPVGTLTSVVFDSQQHSYSKALKEGGSIYIEEKRPA